MPDKKKNKTEDIDEQLDELIANARQQTSTLKKLITEIEKRKTRKPNTKKKI